MCPRCDGCGWGAAMAQACPLCHAHGYVPKGNRAREIRLFYATEYELELLSSPWSWRRRRRIVATVKRESSRLEAAEVRSSSGE